jgi:hypothetical protein
MRAQNIELIYSQYGLLYKVFLDASRSILDKTRHKSRPHAGGIISSAQENPTDSVVKPIASIVNTADNGQPNL